MFKKIKEFFKKNILGIIIGGVIFGSLGVCAASYFPSNNVSYDNKTSGLKSTDVQGAIDELYSACKTPPIGGDGILEHVNIVTSGDGLYKDEYEDDRYFYKGTNPDNYITFNNEQGQWRILSIEADNTIKIVRSESITELNWDSSNSNNWERPSTLNTYLNETYYNNLNSTAKNQIVESTYYIGGVTHENNNMQDQINDEKSVTSKVKVALPTASEYLRANSNKKQCGTYRLNNDNYYNCKNTNWLYKNKYWWTLTAISGSSDRVCDISDNGSVEWGYAIGTGGMPIYPVVYLKSNIKFIAGSGTQQNPFILES